MKPVTKVTHVAGVAFGRPLSALLAVTAAGEVPTTGWTAARLMPRYYIVPPTDGVWDFSFIADEPHGIVGEVISPITAQLVAHRPEWCKGVRVHAASNALDAKLGDAETVDLWTRPTAKAAFNTGHVIVRQVIASFDDSFQPTGRTKFDPWPHAEMKKLHHELELIAEGANEEAIRSCVQRAAAAGLIAAILAAFATGGAALPAAVSAFLAELEACLGSNFSVRVENHSHWVYWWT